jgi:hypothetical protein
VKAIDKFSSNGAWAYFRGVSRPHVHVVDFFAVASFSYLYCATAQVPLQALAHHSPAKPGPIADLFTAETPLGIYQGMSDQIVMSRTPGAFRTILAPRGFSNFRPSLRDLKFLQSCNSKIYVSRPTFAKVPS